MRSAKKDLRRYIVTPEVAKHRIFVWADAGISPDCKLMVITLSDYTTFGILQSRLHEVWSLAMDLMHGVGNDPRYTPTTTFENFPFPEGLTPKVTKAAAPHTTAAKAIAEAAQKLDQLRLKCRNRNASKFQFT